MNIDSKHRKETNWGLLVFVVLNLTAAVWCQDFARAQGASSDIPSTFQVFDATLYKDKPDLLLMHLDESKLTAELKYELAPSINELFPHVFGSINLDAVVKVEKL